MPPTADELLLALDVVREVQAAPDLEGYRRAVLRVRELVPCQEIGYNEVDAETGEIFMILDPPESVLDGLHEGFARNVDQHPVIAHHRETGDGSAHAISDFLSEEEFHATGLYREVYQRMGAEDQLSFILPSPPEMVVGIAMNRAARGFSDGERELVELVRPHLSQAFRDAQLREAADPLSDTRLQGLGLSPREADVARLLVDGRSAQQISEDLTISVHTTRNHIAHTYEKLGVSNRAAAVAAVLRSGAAPDDRS